MLSKKWSSFTKTNPVRERRTYSPNLDIENFGLSVDDLNEVVGAGKQWDRPYTLSNNKTSPGNLL